jgi:hypothetical protein
LPRFRGPPASLSTRTMDVACPVRSPCRMGDRPRPRPQAPAPPAASTDHLFHDRGHEHGARGDHGRLPGGRREFKVQRTRNALLSHRADLETTQLASPTRAQRLCKQGRGVPARPVDGPGKPLAPPGGQIPAQGEPDQPGLGLPAFGSTLPTPLTWAYSPSSSRRTLTAKACRRRLRLWARHYGRDRTLSSQRRRLRWERACAHSAELHARRSGP